MSIATKAARKRARTTTLSGPTDAQPVEAAPAAVANDMRPGLTFRATGVITAPPPPPPLGVAVAQLTAAQIRAYQGTLQKMGLLASGASHQTGTVDAATRAALMAFQRRWNTATDTNATRYRPTIGALEERGDLSPFTQRALSLYWQYPTAWGETPTTTGNGTTPGSTAPPPVRIPTPTVPLRIVGMPRGGTVRVDGVDLTAGGRWETSAQTTYIVNVAPGEHTVTITPPASTGGAPFGKHVTSSVGETITVPAATPPAPPAQVPDPPLGTRSQAQLTQADIARYQRIMTALGDYQGPFDGLLSPATSAGIHAFQQNFNGDTAALVVAFRGRVGALTVDRVPNLGPQTQRALEFFALHGFVATTPVMPTGTGTNPNTNPGTNPGTNPNTNPNTNPGTNPGTNPNTNPNTNPGHPSTVTPPLVTVPPTPKASSSRWPLVLGVVGVAVAGVTVYAVANRHDIADRAAATRRQMMDAIDGAKVRVRSGAARLSAGARRVRDGATRVGQRLARGRADSPRELSSGAYDVPRSDYEIVEPEGAYPYTSG